MQESEKLASLYKLLGIDQIYSSQSINRFNHSSAQLHFSSLKELREFFINELNHPLKEVAKTTVFSNHQSTGHDHKDNANLNYQLMIIGEAPGADEDDQGLPFVGKSGQLLNLMLQSIGFCRDQVYITNLLPWRPPGNRNPSADEMLFFLPYLKEHIRLVNPKCVVLLGSIVTQALFGKGTRITAVRGRWQHLTINNIVYNVLASFHPSYLLRSPKQKRLTWKDWLVVKKYIDDDILLAHDKHDIC